MQCLTFVLESSLFFFNSEFGSKESKLDILLKLNNARWYPFFSFHLFFIALTNHDVLKQYNIYLHFFFDKSGRNIYLHFKVYWKRCGVSYFD